MNELDILTEGLESLEPLFCQHLRSVTEDWKEGNHLDIAYIYHSYNRTEPEENRVKVEKMIQWLKQKIEEDKLIILE